MIICSFVYPFICVYACVCMYVCVWIHVVLEWRQELVPPKAIPWIQISEWGFEERSKSQQRLVLHGHRAPETAKKTVVRGVYIFIHIYLCVCVCVCVYDSVLSSLSLPCHQYLYHYNIVLSIADTMVESIRRQVHCSSAGSSWTFLT